MTEEESSQRLRQLLRLKRHESPPSGYFRDFSGGVIDRIRALEAERSVPVWRRGWFRWAASVPGGSEVRSGFWPLWAGSAAGALALVALMGGLHWGGFLSGTEDSAGGLVQTGSAGVPAIGADLRYPQKMRDSSAALAGMSASDWSDRFGVGESRADDPHWSAGFRWPVSVSIAPNVNAASMTAISTPTSAEISSTNPLPLGLFRLPGASGGAGPEAYRVRFGDSPR